MAWREDLHPRNPEGEFSRSAGASTPPSLPWVDPPPPQGQPGRKAGGFTANGETNTSMGDLGEAALEQLGLKSLLPPGHRQGPLDRGIGDYGFEVKLCTTKAREYKAKPKKKEVESKKRWAKEHGKKPGMLILIADPDAKKAWAYWKEGIGAYRLTSPKAGWNFMGQVAL